MANTKKTDEKLIEKVEVAEKGNDKISELEEKLAKAMEMINKLVETNQEPKIDTEAITTRKLIGEDMVPVISQFVGGLTLTTDGRGGGIPYRFAQFGDIEDIPFSDLTDIVRANKNLLNLFYIADEQAVKQLRLTHIYNKMLSNTDISNLFEKDANTIVDLYNMAPDGQKNIIIDLIMERKLQGQSVDGNVLITLGKLCGKDLLGIEAE